MKKVIIVAILLLLGQTSWAQIREFQTTRLTSTAGAGVASVLSTEAAVLNPSTATFFNNSSVAYHSYSTSLRHENELRETMGKDFKSSRSQGFFMADHTGPVKGGVAYIIQDENDYKRKQLVAHGAAAVAEGTSIGLSYRFLDDKLPEGTHNRSRQHHQASLGLLHVLTLETLIGVVLIDPTRTTPGEERVILGLQQNLTEKIVLIADAGAQYTESFKKKYLWRGAIQLNVFNDFFLRGGRFYDNINGLKGMGWGASWLGPRLGVEFAQKMSDQIGDDSYILKGETIVDTSLSAVIKF